jgi:hypothetical protein
MSDERSSHEPDEPVEDLDVTPDEALGVLGGDKVSPATSKPKVQPQDFNFVHRVDKASPIL